MESMCLDDDDDDGNSKNKKKKRKKLLLDDRLPCVEISRTSRFHVQFVMSHRYSPQSLVAEIANRNDHGTSSAGGASSRPRLLDGDYRLSRAKRHIVLAAACAVCLLTSIGCGGVHGFDPRRLYLHNPERAKLSAEALEGFEAYLTAERRKMDAGHPNTLAETTFGDLPVYLRKRGPFGELRDVRLDTISYELLVDWWERHIDGAGRSGSTGRQYVNVLTNTCISKMTC